MEYNGCSLHLNEKMNTQKIKDEKQAKLDEANYRNKIEEKLKNLKKVTQNI